MVKLYHKLRDTEKTLVAVRNELKGVNDDLFAERKRNIELNQQICTTIDALNAEKLDRRIYQGGFWTLSVLCMAYAAYTAFAN